MMEKFGKNVRKIALATAIVTAPFASTLAKAQGKTSLRPTRDKIEASTGAKKETLNNQKIINQLFTQREITPNSGEAFSKKVEYWYKRYSTEGSPNNVALKGGWNRLLRLNKNGQSDLEIVCNILKKEGVPLDLLFLALAESHWEDTKSSKGAGGRWQFMPNTAKRFNLKDKSDVVESTEKACKYLKWLYDLVKECANEAGVSVSESDAWGWVALAYNRGEGYVLRTPKGKKGDFFKFNGDINEYTKNCKIEESTNYPTKILGIAKASEGMYIMFIKREESASLGKVKTSIE